MRSLVFTVSLLFLVGCGGSSSEGTNGNSHPDSISLIDLNNGGFIIRANVHSLSDGSADINGVSVYFCSNNKYKEVWPNNYSAKGSYTVNSSAQRVIISLNSPNPGTFTIDNGSNFVEKGNTYDVYGDLIDYSFTIIENTKSSSISCN